MASHLSPSIYTTSLDSTLLEQIRNAIWLRQHSLAYEPFYIYWIKCFIQFHHKQFPVSLGRWRGVAFRLISRWMETRLDRARIKP